MEVGRRGIKESGEVEKREEEMWETEREKKRDER